MRFVDREDAGRRLAELLRAYRDENPLILGLPRGGVPVALEVSRELEAPLDVWVVRKVGAPDFPELGVGAVAQGGIVYLNEDTVEQVGATNAQIQRIVREKLAEAEQRIRKFRGATPMPSLEGRTVILVDDGIATGGTVRAAVNALRLARPKKVVLAIPIASTQSLEELAPLVDDVVCLYSTPALYAIGAWYDDFRPISDAEVLHILQTSRSDATASAPGQSKAEPLDPQEVTFAVDGGRLSGTLMLPTSSEGLVLFAHGSGSSRFSPRNRFVASILHEFGVATLLFDLLTPHEEELDLQTAELRFDIALLAERLARATEWAVGFSETRGLPIGYFGSSTGAAAALIAAVENPSTVSAVVCRGGRPDLAGDILPQVRAPTLLIVGGKDHTVLRLNRQAYALLTIPSRLEVVPGATHLFEEPGTLDTVARLAGEWFSQYLPRAIPTEPGLAHE